MRGLVLLGVVIVGGSIGYFALGFPALDAVYQTVTTISTVGYREVLPFGRAEKIFSVALILVGVGTALYTFGVLLETLVEGRLSEDVRRRRMERRIAEMRGHVIVCGWGRVGRTVGGHVAGFGHDVVVVDRDPDRLSGARWPTVLGEATDDATLRRAGIGSARALVAALTTDADNLFVTLSGRSFNPGLFIVARVRLAGAEEKLLQAGADRVVNPQQIGGARMAAFALQPHVAEFLDVVMHDGSLEFRLEELRVEEGSPVAGLSLRDAHLRDRTGALVLALRHPDGRFNTNPDPATVMESGHVLIAIGTSVQLKALAAAVGDTR